MMNNDTLQAGQVILYSGALWRVELVNPSRARIVPLTKRHIVLGGHEFDADMKGVNISARSYVEIVEDVEQALITLEEKRLIVEGNKVTRLKQEITAIAQEEQEVTRERERLHGERERLKVTRNTPRPPQAPRTAGGWHLTVVTLPPLTTGSQAASVLEYIQTHPGSDTGQLAQALPAVKNMAQQLSRLKLTGHIERR